MSKQKYSLRDIARECGVSPPTVSRVLNGVTKGFTVRDSLRLKIVETAKRFDYRPSIVARNLALNHTSTVAIMGYLNEWIVSRPSMYGPMLNSAVQCLKKNGYSVIMSDNAAHEVLAWRVDGTLLLHPCGGEVKKIFHDSSVPCVELNGNCIQSGFSVRADEKSGMRKAVAHLARLGHGKIAYRPPLYIWPHYSIQHRRNAYLEVMEESGLPVMPGHDASEMPLKEWLALRVRAEGVTAVIVYNFYAAMPLLLAAWELGIKVPDSLSVVSYDDVYPCEHLTPPLTTIALRMEEMGEQAALMLINQMRGDYSEETPCCVYTEEDIVVRSSTCPPGR